MIPALSRPLLRTHDGDRRKLTKPSAGMQRALRLTDHLSGYAPARFNITVSHSHRLVWFRVAKVGTRSIFGALRNAGVELDLEEPFGVMAPRALTRGYTRAGFVRHPIDRFLSGWQSTVIKFNHFDFDPTTHVEMKKLSNFIAWFAEQDPATCDLHFRLQSTLLPAGRLHLLGRMETFDTDLDRLLSIIGAPHAARPRLNASPTTPPELTGAERALLIDRYAPDFARFGYEARQ